MVFPLADDNSDRTSFPVVTIVLIVINVLVFVGLQRFGENLDFTFAYSTVPAEIMTGEDIVTEKLQEVQNQGGQAEQVDIGLRPTPVSVYLTLLTSMFMHGGLAHILGNMWFLWIFGDNIENDMGKPRYIAFYLLCGLLASMTHVLLNIESQMPSLGASGAISGVMGAYLVLHAQRRVTVLMFRFVTQVPGFVAVGIWIIFQVISSLGVLGGVESGVAYGAHIGGFVAGAALAVPFTLGRRVKTEPATESFKYRA